MVTAQAQEARRLRRHQLLDAADRVIRRRGAGASMDEIATEAGISKPILYRHFGDKDGLHRALAERYVEALLSELRAARVAGDEFALTFTLEERKITIQAKAVKAEMGAYGRAVVGARITRASDRDLLAIRRATATAG